MVNIRALCGMIYIPDDQVTFAGSNSYEITFRVTNLPSSSEQVENIPAYQELMLVRDLHIYDQDNFLLNQDRTSICNIMLLTTLVIIKNQEQAQHRKEKVKRCLTDARSTTTAQKWSSGTYLQYYTA